MTKIRQRLMALSRVLGDPVEPYPPLGLICVPCRLEPMEKQLGLGVWAPSFPWLVSCVYKQGRVRPQFHCVTVSRNLFCLLSRNWQDTSYKLYM